MASGRGAYTRKFFTSQSGGSHASADVIVPLVHGWLRPKSVLDVGCGVGGWLDAWMRQGVADVMGVDGQYVDPKALQIPADRFVARDLASPVDLGRTFDLVTSLEVAEHLPPAAADTFVATLVRHGPVVLFSAAIPGQGGTGHVNEEWPEAWARRFAGHGYRWADPLRPLLWNDPGVEHWYAQNAILFHAPDAFASPPWRAAPAPAWPLPLVHPETTRPRPDRGAVHQAWRDLRRAIGSAVFPRRR